MGAYVVGVVFAVEHGLLLLILALQVATQHGLLLLILAQMLLLPPCSHPFSCSSYSCCSC
jgi:hypothetical protein